MGNENANEDVLRKNRLFSHNIINMKRRRRQFGRGNELQEIATANRNISLVTKLKMPKPPQQPLGQLLNVPIVKQGFGRKRKRKMRGRGPVLVDKYGSFVHNF